MKSYLLTEPATEENFNEEAYLLANPDVAQAVKEGISLLSGRQHYEIFGKKEGRCIRLLYSVISEVKQKKLEKIKAFLRDDMPYKYRSGQLYDFLTEDLMSIYDVISTEAISSNPYKNYVTELIHQLDDGLVLDCGAGRRDEYFENVVNFEIVDYDTTDVLGVNEKLPFIDNAFDAVISLSVLEHVKDPFQCAKEMSRVLKPGGRLICNAPFLVPYHGYPNHYYNMTGNGLENLFSSYLAIDKVEVCEHDLPVWSITWLIRNWANGLQGESKEEFLQLKIADLIDTGDKYLNRSFVKELSKEMNSELAYGNTLFAHKK